jgi:hypothetical protein
MWISQASRRSSRSADRPRARRCSVMLRRMSTDAHCGYHGHQKISQAASTPPAAAAPARRGRRRPRIRPAPHANREGAGCPGRSPAGPAPDSDAAQSRPAAKSRSRCPPAPVCPQQRRQYLRDLFRIKVVQRGAVYVFGDGIERAVDLTAPDHLRDRHLRSREQPRHSRVLEVVIAESADPHHEFALVHRQRVRPRPRTLGDHAWSRTGTAEAALQSGHDRRGQGRPRLSHLPPVRRRRVSAAIG